MTLLIGEGLEGSFAFLTLICYLVLVRCSSTSFNFFYFIVSFKSSAFSWFRIFLWISRVSPCWKGKKSVPYAIFSVWSACLLNSFSNISNLLLSTSACFFNSLSLASCSISSTTRFLCLSTSSKSSYFCSFILSEFLILSSSRYSTICPRKLSNFEWSNTTLLEKCMPFWRLIILFSKGYFSSSVVFMLACE